MDSARLSGRSPAANLEEEDGSDEKRKIIEKHKRAAARQRAKDRKRQEDNVFNLKKLVDYKNRERVSDFPNHIDHENSNYTLDVFARVFEEKLETYIERETRIQELEEKGLSYDETFSYAKVKLK